MLQEVSTTIQCRLEYQRLVYDQVSSLANDSGTAMELKLCLIPRRLVTRYPRDCMASGYIHWQARDRVRATQAKQKLEKREALKAKRKLGGENVADIIGRKQRRSVRHRGVNTSGYLLRSTTDRSCLESPTASQVQYLLPI